MAEVCKCDYCGDVFEAERDEENCLPMYCPPCADLWRLIDELEAKREEEHDLRMGRWEYWGE